MDYLVKVYTNVQCSNGVLIEKENNQNANATRIACELWNVCEPMNRMSIEHSFIVFSKRKKKEIKKEIKTGNRQQQAYKQQYDCKICVCKDENDEK